jgi:lipopolysaccharide transport system ATP-binding protein
MPPILRVEHLGKRYSIQHQAGGGGYRRLSEELVRAIKRPFSKPKPHSNRNPKNEDFWALRDVSFEVNQGEVVGIIGRNGAGKSTLLKILSRITEPTEGRVSLRGRVASLLEVGTGFHPELTGRENVNLNGAILGMTRAEIKKKFDEIVAFAEVDKFLDTPVKRYSSGMYVRLAFAVAAHLEPEILVIDEVLAVGDSEFQKRCLGKMSEVARGGRTVLFVSHNMGAIRNLCGSGILLEKGAIVQLGAAEEVIRAYNDAGINSDHTYAWHGQCPHPHFTCITVQQGGTTGPVFRIDQPIQIDFTFDSQETSDLVVTVVLRNSQGLCLHHSTDEFSVNANNQREGRRICNIPPYALATETYFLTAALGVRYGDLFQKLTDVLGFQVEFTGRVADRTTAAGWKGACGPGLLKWE